ncbi:winged helix-turn-helix transcriptional regulator [Kitasatospora sp. NPDC058115]|uniref:winged helix-turn-helix transcriptional regulator n=1 Tax=Kitasatospora sp. NPDC058115 TaxID=3346347 RepID=UPI0036DF0799
MTRTVPAPLPPDFFDPHCPVQRVPVLGSRKWAWRIVRCLEGGPRRFSELRVPLTGITAKVLAESLRSMEHDGVVSRTEYAENPPRVEYALTPLGRTLLGPMDAVCDWSRANLAELLAAREAAEGARAPEGAGEDGAGRISVPAGGEAAGGSGAGAVILGA